MPTLAEFVGSLWYYVIMGVAIVLLIVILKVYRSRQT
jgi:hypothetical protein